MNFYFNFFDGKRNEYIKTDLNVNGKIKTNLNSFNLKIFYNEINVNVDKVTDFKLVIERENNGVFYFYKKVDAIVDYYDSSINFNNCKIETPELSNEKFRLYIELYENGMPVYTSKGIPVTIDIKMQCEDFSVDIDGTKKIDDVFEIQNTHESIENITFTVKTQGNSTSNTLLIYNKIDSEYEITYGEFEPLSLNNKSFSINVVPGMFVNNETFVHVVMKDMFGNIRHKKIKLLALGNSFSSFEMFSEGIVVSSTEEHIKTYVDYRNVETITPVITIDEEGSEKKIVSNKTFGIRYISNGILTINLNEHFDWSKIITTNFNVKLSFYLNGNQDVETKNIIISYDNIEPIVKISNLDSNNYTLVKDDSNYFKITGSISEDNIFYIGDDGKKCSTENMENTLIIYSKEEMTHAFFDDGNDGFLVGLISYRDMYICKSYGENVRFLNNGEEVNVSSYINDYVADNKKKLYISIEFDKLSNYERNIIENQGGLILKGPLSLEIESQKFIKYENMYIIEAVIDKNKTGIFSFDLGVQDFDYSFVRYIFTKNISCDMTVDKNVDLSFENTKIVAINTIKDSSLIKFTNDRKISESQFFKSIEISFTFLSTRSDEFFTTDSAVTFFSDKLNTLPNEKIHMYPKLRDKNNVNINYKNFRMNMTSEKGYGVVATYGFEFECPIIDGINDCVLEFEDILEQKSISVFTIEKNNKNVEFTLDYKAMIDSEITKNENGFTLTSNKKQSLVKMHILNENRMQKKDERYVIVKNGDKIQKYKISDDGDNVMCSFYLDNSTLGEKYELYYCDTSNKMYSLILKQQDALTINTENDFITGGNIYYLGYEKDEFSRMEIDYDNREKFTCFDKGKYIEIIRNNNDNFIEDISIRLSLYDKNGNYQVRTKEIVGKFYNETIVVGAEINEKFLDEGRLISPIFDLEIKSYATDDILMVYYNDQFEMDVFKRKKIAEYDPVKEVYIIKNIVAPIIESSIEVSFVLKESELTIKRTLFENSKIMLEKDYYEFAVSSQRNNDNIEFVIKSISGKIKINEIQVICNDVVVEKFENLMFENEFDNKIISINTDNMKGYNNFYLKLITKQEKVVYSKTFSYDFTARNLKIDTNIKSSKQIKTKEDANNIYIDFKEKTGKLIMEIDDIYGFSQVVELKDGINTINAFDYGVYSVKMYYINTHNKKQLSSYKIQVVKKLGDHLTLENRVFEKIKKVTTLSIKNESIFEDYELECYLTQYSNGNFIKNYYPIYKNGKLYFEIDKKYGTNELYLNDINDLYKISEFKHIVDEDVQPKILSITTNNSAIMSIEENIVKMIDYEDIRIKTKNIKKVRIVSVKFGKISERKLSDNFETAISKIMMPCELYFYDKHDNLAFDNPIIVTQYEKQIYTFKIPKVNKNNDNMLRSSLTLSFKDYEMKTTKNVFSMKIKFEKFHPLMSFATSIAKFNGNKQWLEFDKNVRNEIIKKIDCEVYSKLKRKNPKINNSNIKEAVKEEIRRKIGGKN